MKKRIVIVSIAVILLLLFYFLIVKSGFKTSIKPESQNLFDKIKLPPGFKIGIYSDNLGGSPVSNPGPNAGPRMMLLKNNVLYVTIPSKGRVAVLPDKDNNKKADKDITFIDGLNNPHGIDFHEGWFYIAEEDRVIRVKEKTGDLIADSSTIEILVQLPAGGHFTRTVKIQNNSMFISIGSSCNVCYEQDERRASILKCNLDGTNCTVFAKGLRNAVSFVFHPATGEMYATENGRDWIGEDAPPDEINLVEEGKNYGWPVCYGKNIHDADFDKNVYVRNPCMEPFTIPSLVDLQAHSAPLGLAFYDGNSFPKEYIGKLFAAFHGSWNRNVPTGYKIVIVDLDASEVRDFATGWLQGNNIIGRPVDIIVEDEGSIFVSDDNAGKIYRIYYEK